MFLIATSPRLLCVAALAVQYCAQWSMAAKCLLGAPECWVESSSLVPNIFPRVGQGGQLSLRGRVP